MIKLIKEEMSNLKIYAAKSQAKDYISKGYDPEKDVDVITSELADIGQDPEYIEFVLDKMREHKNKKHSYRIDYYGSWDNGHVLHSFKKGALDDAEQDAKRASLEDGNNLYYVVLDDIMDPTTGWQWYRGERYSDSDPRLDRIKRDVNNKWTDAHGERLESVRKGRKITERLGVPDYYGLYIEPNDDDGFIIYNSNEYPIRNIERQLKREWPFLCKEDTEAIKEFILEEITTPTQYNEIIDEYDMDFDSFADNGRIYWMNNKQIQIVRSFMPR